MTTTGEAVFGYLRGNSDVVVGTVFENKFRPVLKVEHEADSVWVVSLIVDDQDLFGLLTIRELAAGILDGLPDDVLLSVKEKARHLAEVTGTADVTQKASARLAGTHPSSVPANHLRTEFIHDTCPTCGDDRDQALIWDHDVGLVGWECPDCRAWVTVRDLEDA